MKNTSDKKKTAYIMVQGTMSNAGKSLIAAGLCRVFKQDGYRVCPFKSQNMALNSYVTKDNLEMGRAQVMQAEAAGISPSVYMNPILLKPTGDMKSQVIVNGRVYSDMNAKEYFADKQRFIPDIKHAIEVLSDEYEIIVIEGAGSPAEINLKQNDIVNMGMAELVDAPVILAADIDRGGVFAQLYGTVMLLEDDEKARIKGLVINKFRGDKTILDPGIEQIEDMLGIPVCGVLPYMDISLDDEDSLSERLNRADRGLIDIAVIRLDHISNFTDFNVFDEYKDVSVRYVRNPSKFGDPDMVIIPGSKNTIGDLAGLRKRGLDRKIIEYALKDKPIIGICGGYQMLGHEVIDSDDVEGGGKAKGLSLLPTDTYLTAQKKRELTDGVFADVTGLFSELAGVRYSGYEIHMGRSTVISEEDVSAFTGGSSGCCKGNVYGTYVHGIFDEDGVVDTVIRALYKSKGLKCDIEKTDHRAFKENQYDKLADMIRQYMDMDHIYRIMGLGS
ncbi:MAG: cobyric acid synthase [Lachnospiraceae bacterium]|nr:cobyric acid synthase [Lachnospiraceae bacterium]